MRFSNILSLVGDKNKGQFGERYSRQDLISWAGKKHRSTVKTYCHTLPYMCNTLRISFVSHSSLNCLETRFQSVEKL